MTAARQGATAKRNIGVEMSRKWATQAQADVGDRSEPNSI
jgi:hypothetical protein|tara:strand:- start:4741 stop:4860 length:120 start_codon:yes stop_codon:yes gene_type:complete